MGRPTKRNSRLQAVCDFNGYFHTKLQLMDFESVMKFFGAESSSYGGTVSANDRPETKYPEESLEYQILHAFHVSLVVFAVPATSIRILQTLIKGANRFAKKTSKAREALTNSLIKAAAGKEEGGRGPHAQAWVNEIRKWAHESTKELKASELAAQNMERVYSGFLAEYDGKKGFRVPKQGGKPDPRRISFTCQIRQLLGRNDPRLIDGIALLWIATRYCDFEKSDADLQSVKKEVRKVLTGNPEESLEVM